MVEYSLYFHIPFCSRKCDYCHFFVLPDKDIYKAQLVAGLKKEWELRRSSLHGKLVSIYFGGGTPSLLGPEYIQTILSWISPSPDIEITLEVNPENVSLALMQAYHQIGINRISLGVQSFDDTLLQILSRTHDAKQSEQAVLMTREAGISNISIDLMYDLPDQTEESWQETLDKTLSLPITHLSLYNLTMEPHTVFYKKRKSLSQRIQSELPFLEMALSALSEWKRYEISAFTKGNHPSIHNLGYWTGRPFLGLGPSAFSYWEKSRFRNIANLSKYCKLLEEGILPVDFSETLTQSAQLKELLVIRLRVLSAFLPSSIGEFPKETYETLSFFASKGLIDEDNSQVQLTRLGAMVYDAIASELIESPF